MKQIKFFVLMIVLSITISVSRQDDISLRVNFMEREIAAMKSTYQQQKSTYELKLSNLQSNYQQLVHEVTMVKTKTRSQHCKLLSTDICGPCTCFDDFELKEKYYCDCQNLSPKRDCLAFYQAGIKTNGIYKVTMNNIKTMEVYCDQTTDGGGWTVIQRRVDGTVNFYRNWKEYKEGFGKYQHEFYLGNEKIYILSLQGMYPKGSELRIDMEDWEEKKVFAKYSLFQIGNEVTKYQLHASGFSGNAGDSLAHHNGRKFSTYDQDNDDHVSFCARKYRGSWWYGTCHDANLNGEYRLYGQAPPGPDRGVIWNRYKGTAYSLKTVEMKVRRKA